MAVRPLTSPRPPSADSAGLSPKGRGNSQHSLWGRPYTTFPLPLGRGLTPHSLSPWGEALHHIPSPLGERVRVRGFRSRLVPPRPAHVPAPSRVPRWLADR